GEGEVRGGGGGGGGGAHGQGVPPHRAPPRRETPRDPRPNGHGRRRRKPLQGARHTQTDQVRQTPPWPSWLTCWDLPTTRVPWRRGEEGRRDGEDRVASGRLGLARGRGLRAHPGGFGRAVVSGERRCQRGGRGVRVFR